MSKLSRIGGGLLALLLAASTALPAAANDDDVIRRGACQRSTDWKLKASPEDGRIEVEAEVDSSVNRQTWRWRMVHDGFVSARGRAITHAPSGSFEVRRVMVNARGVDHIVFRAVNRRSGEICRGSLRF